MPAVMLVAVVGMIAAMVLSGAGRSPMTFIFPLMLLGSMAMMFQPGQNVDEIRRSFHRHIDALSDTVQRKRSEQLKKMEAAHPHPAALWTLLVNGETPNAPPGVVRLGVAVQAPEDPLEIPVTAPPEDLEPVSAMSLRDLAIRSATIEAPVAVDLASFQCVVIVGDGARGLARAMQAQLAMQDPSQVGITGPFEEWLPHDGPKRVHFVTGEHPITTGAVVVEPTAEWMATAKTQGLLIKVDSDRVMHAWTVDGWAPFGMADDLSNAELARICRARTTVKGNTSLLELPGGDLRAPIGFSSSPVYLDIKEAALGGIGPHGLCIGATGSGKSELLKSVVVSFAHQHTAEELNFILVDFKGGASFLGLERLPHTSAVITNLADEAGLVDRMQDSLLGEMHRRQERLRRANMTTAAEFNQAFPGEMPALFIVVDEFSELLHARPEFAEVFTAIGRLGRSLRMHLLLASQRLEEGRLRGLESHLSYRKALRTFSAVESRSLIGSTAAYELPSQPGAAILAAQDQVRFQSAYVSGPELPRDQRLVRRLGTAVEAETTTLQLVVDRLAGPNRNPVWLPPLPEQLPASDIMQPVHPLVAQIGLEDLPFEGQQLAYQVDFSRRHWAVVGQPRTGKTNAVRTIVLGAIWSTPGLAVYVFDPGGGLKHLERLPQVAAVVGTDGLARMFDELEQTSGQRLLVIDGVDLVGEEEHRLIQLATTGLERGLHVVLTSLRWNLRPSLRDVLTGHLELRMTPLDAEFRDAQKSLPDVPGRGVGHRGKHIHLALTTGQDVEHIRKVTVDRGEVELRMRVLPESIEHHLLADDQAFALGGPRLDPVRWDYRQFPHLVVVGQAGSGVTTALRTAVHCLPEKGAEVLITDTRRGLLGMPGYAVPEHFRSHLEEWAEGLRKRIPSGDVSPAQLRDRSWWDGPELFVIVDDADSDPGLDELLDLLPFAADIGLHLVLGRRSGQFQRASFQPVMETIRDQTAWVVLSAPRDDGPIAGVRTTKKAPGRATFVHSETWEVQIAHVEDRSNTNTAPGNEFQLTTDSMRSHDD